MVFVAIVNRECEEILQGVDVVRKKNAVICLAHRCHFNSMKGDSESRFLGSIKLLVVVNQVEVTRRDPTLFNTLLIVYWTKNLAIPFAKSLPEFESVVKIKQSITSGAKEIKFPGEDLPYGSVESRTSVQEQSKDRLVVDLDGVVYNLRQKESAQLMAHARAKKLDFGSCIIPVIDRELSDVGV